MEHHPVHPETVKYMRKHKQGMFSSADKKLVKENTQSNAKTKALAKKLKPHERDWAKVSKKRAEVLYGKEHAKAWSGKHKY